MTLKTVGRLLVVLMLVLAGGASSQAEQQKREKPDLEALLQIQLPENPTNQQVEEYIQRILWVSRGQKEYLAIDPQVEMLEKVGPQHIDLLLRATRGGGYSWLRYPNEAIKRLATEQHKTMIIEALPQHLPLVEIVVEKGWIPDAKDTLYKELRAGGSGYLPLEWIGAVASFKDQETYEGLKRYFVDGMNKHATYTLIKDLPGIELEASIPKAWERAVKSGWNYDAGQLAPVAVEVGYLPALEFVFKTLEDNYKVPVTLYDARAVALRFTDAMGSNDELRAWFVSYRRRLTFDQESKKFVPKP